MGWGLIARTEWEILDEKSCKCARKIAELNINKRLDVGHFVFHLKSCIIAFCVTHFVHLCHAFFIL